MFVLGRHYIAKVTATKVPQYSRTSLGLLFLSVPRHSVLILSLAKSETITIALIAVI